MRYTTLWILLWWIAVTAEVATADEGSLDYRKIDRSLVKEPEYSSGEPLYGLLLFGRQATFRVWIVLDGETIYVDRNGDGDLTTEDERFSTVKDCRNVEVGASSETAVYTITAIGRYEHGEPASIRLMPFVKIAGAPEYQQYGGLTMENSPGKAKVAHFDGPLTISWEPELGANLSSGDRPSEIYALVGTIDRDAGCSVVVMSHNGDAYAFDKGVVPELEIEFPRNNHDGPMLTKRYPLDGFC